MQRTILAATIVTWTLLAALPGCEKDEGRASLPPTTAPSTQPAAAELAATRAMLTGTAKPAALPANHPPLSDVPPPAGMMGEPRAALAGVLKYTAPSAWQQEQPKIAMRAAQFRLPRVGNDPEDGELAVFDPSIGGGVEANLARWRSQFTTPDGQPVPDAAFVREALEVDGLKVTVIDVAGRYAGAAMMGAPTNPKENYRMLGAIVETPDGPWYFKATGPGDTMAAQRAAFLQFMRTMRYEANAPPPGHGVGEKPSPSVEPNTPGKG